MIRQKVTITNPTGLHLRPAGMFCNIASRYKCKVEFMYNDDTAANAKSVLSVLGACVKSGDEIELICDGEDEEEAMKAMMDAVESGLGELEKVIRKYDRRLVCDMSRLLYEINKIWLKKGKTYEGQD